MTLHWVPPAGTGGGAVAVDDDGTEVVSSVSRLNFGTDLSVTDDGSGEVTINSTASGGGGGALVDLSALATSTGATVTLPAGSVWQDIDWTNLTATVSASAGDVLEIHARYVFGSNDTFGQVRFVTVVAGAVVNSSEILPHYKLGVDDFGQPTRYLTVQAGDLDGGSVTVRMQARSISGGVSRTLLGGGQYPRQLQVANLGPA